MTTVDGVPFSRVQKICTLRTHDETFSREDVVINFDRFTELGLQPGKLGRITLLKTSTAVRDFEMFPANENPSVEASSQTNHAEQSTSGTTHFPQSRSNRPVVTIDENARPIKDSREADESRSYVFVLKDMTAEQKSRNPQMSISISSTIAAAFGFRVMTSVLVAPTEEQLHAASHVEITFRDQYLARGDMWRLATNQLGQKTVYKGQKLLFLGSIKASVKNVYIDGRTVHSAYFSPTTKTIFRSESARTVLFLQMSREMWDFDSDGSGEIMFNKVINGFFPELFKRWMKLNARHLITIVMFTRLEYDRPNPSDPNFKPNAPKPTQDFYRVVVSEWASGDWIYILETLKQEFKDFLRDVCIMKNPEYHKGLPKVESKEKPDYLIRGTPTLAPKGNVLEAVNLATSQFAHDYIDRDLIRTGISIMVVTPGTGVFEVDYGMLKLTNDILVNSNIAIDLVCLSRMPLHSVPLFKYKSPYTAVQVGRGRAPSLAGDNISLGSTPRQTDPVLGYSSSTAVSSRPTTMRVHPIALRHVDALNEVPSLMLPSDRLSLQGERPGEWCFAMPHWVDISFWSGPAEEELDAPARRSTRSSKSSRKRSVKPFRVRCRMYELQMMGIMESEMSNISIPYLVNNPLVEPSALSRLTNTSNNHGDRAGSPDSSAPSTAQDGASNLRESAEKAFRADLRQYMDDYDDNVFRKSHPQLIPRSPGLNRDRRSNTGSRTGRPTISDQSTFGASLNEAKFSPGSFGDASRSGFLDRKMTERRGSRPLSVVRDEDTVEQSSADKRHTTTRRRSSVKSSDHLRTDRSRRQSLRSKPVQEERQQTPVRSKRPEPRMEDSITSIKSTESTTSSRPSLMSRQFSLGLGGLFGSQKATASTALSSANVTSTGGDHDPASAKSTPSSNAIAQFKALTRKSSTYSTLSNSNDDIDDDSPTKPIAIKRGFGNRGDDVSDSQQLPVAGSEDTLRVDEEPGKPQDRDVSPKGPVLYSAHRGGKDALAKAELSTSGGGRTLPKTLSPTSALSPWMVLVNPCNPKKNDMNVSKRFRRWQHVYPKLPKMSAIKWKSLCSPASVPLTNDYFPAAQQLAEEYEENPYKVSPVEDYDAEEPKSREDFIRELVAFRLSHGFQIIVGPAVAEFAGVQETDLSDIFDRDFVARDGSRVFMVLGNNIHQLVCLPSGEVEVKRFRRKPTAALESLDGSSSAQYAPMIRTQFSDRYDSWQTELKPPREEYNWNNIDNFIAGYEDEFSDALRFWRSRFVLIPVEIPLNRGRPLPTLNEDSAEEIRLEGIRKLTQLWQRHRFLSPDERHFQALRDRKDPNPLAIEYQTRDPSAIVAAAPDIALLTESEPNLLSTQLFSSTETYCSQNIDLHKLAMDIQSENGIPVMDRRWHWRLHYNCFVGVDLVNWLLQHFRDIETREDAVGLGGQLMDQGLFQHVQKKHQFRDGNFFFQIASEYRAPRPESRMSWFGRRPDRSIPSTPMTARRQSRPNTQDSAESGEKTPVGVTTPRRKVMLSYCMRYDVDSRKRSYRPEIINLHYDRLHNPDNCYHIRIDWMNVTAKLIEDSVSQWSSMVERFGLKLVEIPIAEACTIGDTNPFRSPYIIKLASQPPDILPVQTYFDTTSFGAQPSRADKFVYHKALLRKLDFVLDNESADSFPPEMDVSYSWGKPDYRYTQYIHRSGVLLCQIMDDGNLLLAANRLYTNRATREGTRADRPVHPPTTPGVATTMKSPLVSPLVKPVQDISTGPSSMQVQPWSGFQNKASQTLPTLRQIRVEMEAFCHDAEKLKAFWEEVQKPREVGPSPALAATTSVGTPGSAFEDRIPSFGLPPSITVKGPGNDDGKGVL